MIRVLAALLVGLFVVGQAAQAQNGPLRIEITDGVVEPLPYAVPNFVPENSASGGYAKELARVIASDLSGTGLFREISEKAHISKITNFASPVQFADWKAVNAQALITGAVKVSGNQLEVKFRVYDVFAGQELGNGLRFKGTVDGWRRMAHKVADAVYSRITGEGGYFDSRVVFVSETGPKNDRKKRLAIMDYDGANLQYLTDSSAIVLAPRFSPMGDKVLYTSYETGFPQVYILDVGSVKRRVLHNEEGSMSFAPRFAPDGKSLLLSITRGGNTDIFKMDIASGRQTRLTSSPAIDTAPSFSPDGSQIVFESDRSGSQQLYVMPANGGEPRRISFGQGRYGTPVWSPRGDLVAFTKQNKGRFHIGVMRTDGSEERLLTASFLDEGPTWAPNGRVIMFTRETQGANGSASLFSVDVSGRNLKKVKLAGGGSDPAWSPLQK
ncbi:Tol-Pal system beta propeller repeat protein TolB [Shimia sp. CNT1-13L.2]|uniref:Tol-Pal system beta propeller repeat protein TolB n=1 Tax=Shimia sp. CNT1-13L.2 TaxID=2959663 RepID=UPI0020CEBA58|nr:Tol-Pal system beta propeller repeat protein TolB [Shimia sp. CNT1-13L.2]MCP9482752.1 Tol-Pal system beta propeller repeat protein TolB [Shimia sp. CNT1-13L.2]